jgi:hypothetical protein
MIRQHAEPIVEADAPPLTPPWFLPGTEVVWGRIAETERALRRVVRETYVARFGPAAARRLEESLGDRERKTLSRALRSRPPGADELSIVDYMYLGQLPVLLTVGDVWSEARERLGGAADVKPKLQAAVGQIAPVRNEIAHVREVDADRFLRATVACADVLRMVHDGSARS